MDEVVNEILDELENKADEWAEEIQLAQIAVRITGDTEAVHAMLKQAHIEGLYRGFQLNASKGEG